MRSMFYRKSTLFLALALGALFNTDSFAEFPPQLELSSLDGTNGFVLKGNDNGDMTGGSVASAGDFNGDGIKDIIVGARYHDSLTGRAYVVYGKNNWPASINLAEINGLNGFIINGMPTQNFSIFGESVASAGDFNADGISDLIIGARGVDFVTGEVYIIYGTSGMISSPFDLTQLNGSNGLIIKGVTSGDEAGYSVAGCGDFNGDDIDDIIVGALSADSIAGTEDNRGKAYIIFGKPGGHPTPLRLANLTAEQGLVLHGVADWDQAGWSVAGANDVNGDGLSDIITGAPHVNPDGVNYGQAYVVFGRATPTLTGSIHLDSLDGNNGFKISSGLTASGFFGGSVAGIGDINADGYADVIVGARDAYGSTGRAYVIYGSATEYPPIIVAELLDGQTGFKLACSEMEGGSCGESVAGAGDLNGDGCLDFTVGAPGKYPNGLLSGQTFVIYGRAEAFPEQFSLDNLDGVEGFKINGVSEFDASGSSVAALGDINNDNADDLIIGAPYAWASNVDHGEAYVVLGRKSIQTIQIDINPKSTANTIYLNSKGIVPVAILGNNDLDVETIDQNSIVLGGSRVKIVAQGDRFLCQAIDINKDDFTDLYCKIAIDEFFEVQAGDTEAELTAKTYTGQKLKGIDSIKVVPSK
ncbi:MAG: integrin alpha [Desulfuromonadales bacterium]|nr:integrin alpha [Desulfuromonadales bacterium]